MAKTKSKRNNFLDYLRGASRERFDFSTPQEAYEFGTTIRANLIIEGIDCVEVDISNTIVRIKVLQLQEQT